MDMPVKDSPGLCRCCFSEGCYKDLSTAYAWMGDTEIYADMLLECFDISITQHVDGPNGPNRLICEVCITRLRDASNFKKQVLNCEKKFIDMVAKGAFKASTSEFNVQVSVEKEPKLEPILEEDIETPNLDYLDVLDYDDDFDPKGEASTSHQSDDNEPLAKLTTRKRKLKPKKETATKAAKGKAPKVVKKEEKPKATKKGPNPKIKRDLAGPAKSDSKQRLFKGKWCQLTTISDSVRENLRKNLVILVKNSNVMPFRWLRTAYRCFYCYDIIEETSALKKHQEKHDAKNIIDNIMKNYWENDVLLDTSDIACKHCHDPIKDLYDLTEHLASKHDVVCKNIESSKITAFKLDDKKVTCTICDEKFLTFGPLLTHSYKYHKGASDILCDFCGQQFKNGVLLYTHLNDVHRKPKVKCEECGEICDTKNKLLTHKINMHNKMFKCLICSEMFKSRYIRSKHMAAAHKSKSEFQCPECPKTFVYRSTMLSHAQIHVKEKRFPCPLCDFSAPNSTKFKSHMCKHTGERNFKCPVCEKGFRSSRDMKKHCRLVHKIVHKGRFSKKMLDDMLHGVIDNSVDNSMFQ